MKKIIILLAVVLLFSACEIYDSLPEPLLPIEDIHFSGAVYTAGTALSDPEINITLSPTLPFSGIYTYYNRIDGFNFTLYLKGSSSKLYIESVTYLGSNPITGLKITLKRELTEPLTLTFNTKEPMYLYNDAGYLESIVAKGYIKTPSLTVAGIP